MFDWIKIGRLVLVLVFGLFTGSQILAAQLTGNFLRSPIPLDVPLDAGR